MAWHLRTPDGTIYGPAKVEALRNWAQQGRIGPGCHVSADGTDWMPAESLKALDISWQVDMGQGTLYGPLNLAAVQGLVNEGTIAPDAPLIHAVTREKTTVQEKLAERPPGATSHERLQEDALRKHNQELSARVAELEAGAKTHDDALRKKQQLTDELGRVRKRENHLQEQVTELQRALAEATVRMRKGDAQLKAGRARQEHLEQELFKKKEALDDALQKLSQGDLRLREQEDAHAADAAGWRREVQQLKEEQVRRLEDISRVIEKHLEETRPGHSAYRDEAESPDANTSEVTVEHIAPGSVRPQPTSIPLERIEAQVQRELEAWASARSRATKNMQNGAPDPESSIPPRRVFDL